jgi:hypothetical protein
VESDGSTAHLLASTLVVGARLWTAGVRLAENASEMGMAFMST